MKYGDVITVKGKYRRVNKRIQQGLDLSKMGKVWEFVSGEITGIYLGERTLANGWNDYDPEYGYLFNPTEHFKVLLVSPSARLNPVYAPIKG